MRLFPSPFPSFIALVPLAFVLTLGDPTGGGSMGGGPGGLFMRAAQADYLAAEAAMQAGDFAGAVPLLAEEAKLGNPVAAFNLGKIYEEGAGGVPTDFVAAATYYKIAATLEIAPAFNGQALGPQGPKLIEAAQQYGQYALGRFYEEGKGVPVDIREAVSWYTRAADLGNQQAMLKLALLYRDGAPDFPANGQTSAIWLERAAGEGNPIAMSELGMAYLKGLGGLPPNAKQAAHWFGEAAALGSVEADYNLGLIYEAGLLGTPDPLRAAQHFERAANARDGLSMLALGDLYTAGQGLPRDLVQAHLWYNLAKDNGAPEGQQKLQAILPQMPPADIAAAEALYTSWRPGAAGPNLPDNAAQPAAAPGTPPAASPETPPETAPETPPVTPTATPALPAADPAANPGGAAPAPLSGPATTITTPDLPPLFSPNTMAPAPANPPAEPQPYDPNNSGAPAPDAAPPSSLIIPPTDTPPPPPAPLN